MTPSQELANAIFKKTRLLENLSPFNPVFIGTIPIDIDIPGSDIDIACEVYDARAFHKALPAEAILKSPLLAHITTEQLPIEIYAAPLPVTQQRGYIHMKVEEKILALASDTFREQIRGLKKQGIKTEPAFAKLLKLKGDPYIALLELAHLSTRELQKIIKQSFD